ncbi:MAG TPA: TonB-dependent receptor [Vicinamibacterales bacterium]|jgi:TonB-dependent receptor-like protein/carboxypeptidase family protein|nr:TonB-dependent receptor [Vicinamibacterales bacterium]
MGYRGRLILPALTLSLLAAGPGPALAQAPLRQAERITELAAISTGQIVGQVHDEGGNPIEGVVVSALGSANAFAVSDKLGQFSLRQLPPGPYLVRAHREGFLTVRGTIVEVRPSSRTPSSLTMHREGAASAPRVTEASLGTTAVAAAPGPEDETEERSETSLAWRLRHMKRSILRDTDTMAVLPPEDFSFTDPFEFLGRAVEQSARAAGALFADISLDGQVDLLTTGAFDSPTELLQMDRTRSVAFFSVGSNVGDHGAWAVRAAMNQGDLNSWILAGSYAARAGVPHRYEAGMSYSLQRYQGGNTAALAALPDTARNVGAVFAYDEWALSPRLTVGYGANFAYYDYLVEPSLLSPRLTASYRVTPVWRVRGLAARQLSAPGAQEFLPPTRASWLPPQRTFSSLSRESFHTQALEHYEVGVDRLLYGATIGVRAFRQQVDDQMVTLFGLRQPDGPAEALGHYYVGTVGDANIDGVGLSVSHALTANVRGSVEYSFATAQWTDGPPRADAIQLARFTPAVLPTSEREHIHDLMTSIETEVPQTATRVVLFYRVNNAFVKAEGAEEVRGLDGRFELQVNQSLPFMNFMRSQWEMLVAVRNMFNETLPGASIYNEILVVRPPKRLVGGLTVRF